MRPFVFIILLVIGAEQQLHSQRQHQFEIAGGICAGQRWVKLPQHASLPFGGTGIGAMLFSAYKSGRVNLELALRYMPVNLTTSQSPKTVLFHRHITADYFWLLDLGKPRQVGFVAGAGGAMSYFTDQRRFRAVLNAPQERLSGLSVSVTGQAGYCFGGTGDGLQISDRIALPLMTLLDAPVFFYSPQQGKTNSSFAYINHFNRIINELKVGLKLGASTKLTLCYRFEYLHAHQTIVETEMTNNIEAICTILL